MVATGGTGWKTWNIVQAVVPAANQNTLTAIQTALGTYISKFTSDTAVPIGFHVVPMTFTGWKSNSVDSVDRLQGATARPDCGDLP